MALHGKATLSKIQDGIDNGTPFHAGNVRGLVGAADGSNAGSGTES